MRIRVLLAAALPALLALAGCSDDDSHAADARTTAGPSVSTSASPSGSATPVAARLPTGKDDLDVEASSHLSPEGFAPELRLDLQYSGIVGWTSVHRGADAFDLGLPADEGDGPLVAVAFVVPPQASAAEALAAVRDDATRVGAQVRDVTGPFGDLGAEAGVDVVGGEGQVLTSSEGGIALDAVQGGRLQVFATDQGGSPLVIAVFAPDAKAWPQVKDVMAGLSGAVTLARG
jgi:hypothetical protein